MFDNFSQIELAIIGRGVACPFREVNLHYAEYCVQLEMSVVRSSEVSVFRGEFT